MILTVYLACFLLFLIVPLNEILVKNTARIYSRRLREHQIRVIQRQYPELRALSWAEIEQYYSVEKLYRDL